jgi:hypothetical protein
MLVMVVIVLAINIFLWSDQGFRVLGVATKAVDTKADAYSSTDESTLTFAGFLLFFDVRASGVGVAQTWRNHGASPVANAAPDRSD